MVLTGGFSTTRATWQARLHQASPKQLQRLIPIRSFSEVLGADVFVDHYTVGFPGGSVVMNPPAIVGEAGWIPGSGRSPG